MYLFESFEGDFYLAIRKHCHTLLEDEEEGLEIVDPEIFVPDAHDLGEDFTRSILDRATVHCHGFGPGEDLAQARWEKEKEDFRAFFPFGWNRTRPLHPCPPGCCGPTACHSRAVSVQKAKAHTDKVILKGLVNHLRTNGRRWILQARKQLS